MLRRARRQQLASTAGLILSGTNSLSDLIARTEYSREMLAYAIDLLHEAAQALGLPMNGTGRILALRHEGAPPSPLPDSINAAQRIAGHLSGILPRAPYLQISECGLLLAILDNFFIGADAHLVRCTEILGLQDESPQSERWSDRMSVGPVSCRVARSRLADADLLAADAHSGLLRLLTHWQTDASLDLSLAEENLHAATDQMDQALAAMRQVHNALELQGYELCLIVARRNQ